MPTYGSLTVSDLFSFYKEEKAGEQHNFIHHYARVYGKTVPEALEVVLDETVALVSRIEHLLSGVEKDAWNEFAAGYTQFHVCTPRYRLEEILPELL